MKKTIISLCLFCLSFNILAQKSIFPLEKNSGKIVYTGIVEIPELNKDELFTKSNEWSARMITSAKSAIEFSDKEAGKLIINSNFKTYFTKKKKKKDVDYFAGNVYFYLELSFKDGKYKYKISDIRIDNESSGVTSPSDLRVEESGFMLYQWAWDSIKENTNNHFIEIIESIKTEMLNNDDW